MKISIRASHSAQDGQSLAFAGDARRRAAGGRNAPVAVAQGETGQPMGPAESKLRHCLTARTRRWAVCEFFYSAIDRPWFLRNELQVP